MNRFNEKRKRKCVTSSRWCVPTRYAIFNKTSLRLYLEDKFSQSIEEKSRISNQANVCFNCEYNAKVSTVESG